MNSRTSRFRSWTIARILILALWLPVAAVAAEPPEPDLWEVEEWPADAAVVGASATPAPQFSAEAPDEAAPPDPYAPSGGYRSELERAWFQAGPDPATRARRLRVWALETGADNVEAAARALMAPAAPALATQDWPLVVRLAPDLPLAHMALARVYWQEGERRRALSQVFEGFAAIPRHLEASLWIAGSLLAMLAAVLALGSAIFIAVVGVSVFRHAAHDLGDLISEAMPNFARAALLGALLVLPLSLGEGALGVLLVLLALGIIYGGSRYRFVLVLSAVLIVLGLYPVARFAGMALGALDSDPVASAALSVLRGTESPAEVDLLMNLEDESILAQQLVAHQVRRQGQLEEAEVRYRELLKKKPAHPLLLTNLGNLRFRAGETEEAIDLYQRAVPLVDSALLYFNLSQAHARSFQMEEYEAAISRAQSIDPELVAELSSSGDSTFVSDLPQMVSPIRQRLLTSAKEAGMSDLALRLVAPGRLGSNWPTAAGSLAVVILLASALSGLFDHASVCGRCGRRICGRCDGTVWNSEICEGCYRLFNRPETTDATLRMARLKDLRIRELRLDKIAFIASVLIPGAAGLLAKRPDLGFLGIFFFVWAAVSVVWRNGVVPDPLSVGAAGPLVFSLAAAFALISYAGVVIRGLLTRKSL